jgi:uncharacterized protein YceK
MILPIIPLLPRAASDAFPRPVRKQFSFWGRAMPRRAVTSLAAVLLGALSGCGTSLNLDGDSRVYGGIVQDFQVVRERLAQAASPSWPGTPGSSPAWNLTVSALALADVPLSLVGDTFTLPFTIPTALEDKDPATSPAQGDSANKPRPAGVSMGW